MAEPIVAESLLKKAVNFLFKGLGDILKDAEAIQKNGKPGIRVNLLSMYDPENERVDFDDVEDLDQCKFYYISGEFFSIKGKHKYYCDELTVKDARTGEEIGLPGSATFKPFVVDDNEEAAKQYIQEKYMPKYESKVKLGNILSHGDKEKAVKYLKEGQEPGQEVDSNEPKQSEETEQQNSSSSTIVNAQKLRMTLAPIEGSTDLSVSHIWTNYSMIAASDDIFALVGSPDVAALVNAEPVTVEVTQTDDDYDVEVVEAVEEDCIECTYQLAYSSLMELYCQASVQSWLEDTSYIGEKLNYSGVVYVLSDALETIVMRMKHLGLEDNSIYQSRSNIIDAPLSCPKDFLNKAKDILYLLAEDLPDPTVFDREIDNINRNMTQY